MNMSTSPTMATSAAPSTSFSAVMSTAALSTMALVPSTGPPAASAPANFDVSDADLAGLIVGPFIMLAIIAGINAWYYVSENVDYAGGSWSPERRRYVSITRGLGLFMSIVALGLLNDGTVSDPCFFGYDFMGNPNEAVCELGFGLGSVTLVYCLVALAITFVWLDAFPFGLRCADFGITFILMMLWFASGVIAAVQLARRRDRCEVAACAPDGGYEIATMAVAFFFLLFASFLAALPDAFQALGLPLRGVKDYNQVLHEILWRLLELFLLNLVVMGTSASSDVLDGRFCWFGRDACPENALGDETSCRFAMSVPAISILIHVMYAVFAASDIEQPLEWVTAPLMAMLWVIYAGVLSVEHGRTCEAFFGSVTRCRDADGYELATTAITFAWLSAASSSGYALWISMTRFRWRVARARFTIGRPFNRLQLELALAAVFAIVEFALVSRQVATDPNSDCFYGRDTCGGVYESACNVGIGNGVVALVAAVVSIAVAFLDTSDREVPYPVVFLAPSTLFIWLATGVVLAHGSSITVDNFGQRSLEGYRLAILAVFFSWLNVLIWAIITLDVLTTLVYRSDTEITEFASQPPAPLSSAGMAAGGAGVAGGLEAGNIYESPPLPPPPAVDATFADPVPDPPPPPPYPADEDGAGGLLFEPVTDVVSPAAGGRPPSTSGEPIYQNMTAPAAAPGYPPYDPAADQPAPASGAGVFSHEL